VSREKGEGREARTADAFHYNNVNDMQARLSVKLRKKVVLHSNE
jgi:hypothetical protein